MTIISIKDYYAVQGSRYSDSDAAVIGPALSELAIQGEIKAREVVDVAKSSNSPLHKYFEWNDARAADHYRLEQARHMLRSIKVKYTENGTEKIGRAFMVTTKGTHKDGGRHYSEFTVLHGDRAVAVHMMRNALKELVHWKQRYEQHQDEWEKIAAAFNGVFNRIEEMETEARPDDDMPVWTEKALAALKAWVEEHEATRQLWAETAGQLRYVHEAICDAERLFEFVEKKHVRKCLKCTSEFVSDGPGNRLCRKCSRVGAIDDYAM